MASNPLAYDVSVKAAVDAFCAQCNSGFLNIYSGTQPALNGAITGTRLAHLLLSATAFAASTASAGTVTATANAITADAAAVAGTATHFALLKSDNATIVATGTADVSANSPDLALTTTAISAGATVSCSSFTVTMPG